MISEQIADILYSPEFLFICGFLYRTISLSRERRRRKPLRGLLILSNTISTDVLFCGSPFLYNEKAHSLISADTTVLPQFSRNSGEMCTLFEFGSQKKKVSVIGVGCMRIADMTESEIDAFVKGAMETGINFFDHADIYAGGKSEDIFGTVLAAEPSLCDKMFLQSKAGIHSGMFDFSKDYILGQVDRTLANLRTDHLDSLLLHRPDALMEPDEVMEG
jgi:hypothetical protein